MLWGVASGYRLGRADTAEVVQVTWLRLVEHLDRIKQPEAIGGWLATTARREALRMLRMRDREVLTADDGSPSGADRLEEPEAGPEERVMTGDRNRVMWTAFERLPEHCRTLLRLLAVEAPPYAEVSRRLGMPVGSIGPTRARCLARLRSLLEADGPSGIAEA
jgi:RNA polymerase sigma factor (sigma-70 family)